MFHKYTEKARQLIFFARHEASQHDASSIEPEHLLLGLLRADQALFTRFLPANVSLEVLREQVEARTDQGQKISTAAEFPLSGKLKNVLEYAAAESEHFSHWHIGTEHLLLGLLRESASFVPSVLQEHGLNYSDLRKVMEDESWRLS